MTSMQLRGSRQAGAVLVFFALWASACGGSSSTEASPTSEAVTTTTLNIVIKEANDINFLSRPGDQLTIEVGDDFVDINVKGATGFPKVEAYLTKIGCSGSIWARIGKTRALDGTQRASCEFADLSWTYHPDSGLNIVAEVK